MRHGENPHDLPSAPQGGFSTGGPIIVTDQSAVAPWWPEDNRESEFSFSIVDYWRLLIKHRWLILSAVALAVVVGLVVTLLTRPMFTASTTLQIDREAAKIVDMEGITPAEALNGEEFFQTQYGLLKSDSLAGRVVDDLRLTQNPKYLEMIGGAPEPGQNPADVRRRAIKAFSENLQITPVRGSRLVSVSFSSPDPKLSADIANAVGEKFIATNLERRYEASSYAREFLEGRLTQIKQRLEDSEKQLVAYAAAQGIINVSPNVAGVTDQSGASQSLVASDLTALNTALSVATGDRIRAEQKWRQAQGPRGESLPEALQNPTIQILRQERAKLAASYQEQLRTYKPEFPAMQRLQSQMSEIDKQIAAEVRNVQQSLRAQYEVAADQERSFSRQVEGLKSSFLNLRDRSIQYNILQREVDTNRTLYDGLLQRYKEIGVAGGVGSNNVSVVDRAEAPRGPSKPKPVLNILVALIAGLLLGMLAAILFEIFDESIATPEAVESKLKLSLLGSTPLLDKGVTTREAMNDPRSPFSEAYYSIRTALQFSTADGVPRSLLVTSTRPAEGKSTSSLAIAQNFARLGLRVLLVDGDLRNPSLHRILQCDNAQGFSNYLTGSALQSVVQDTDLGSLSFIPCGPLPPNPAELLGGPRLRLFVAEATAHYDVVVIDGPPVLGLADAPILASAVMGTVLVVEAGGTRRGMARSAIRRLSHGRTRLLGVVLTKFNARKASYGYGYGYSYAYEYNYGGDAAKLPRRGAEGA